MSNTPETPAAKAPAKKSKLLLIIIIAVVAVAGGGGFVVYRKVAASPAAEETAEKHDSEDEEEPEDEEDSEGEEEDSSDPIKKSLPDDEDVKTVIALDPFIVNLADSGDPHYLRLTVSLGVGESEEGHEEGKADPVLITRVRNAMLAVLTTKSSAEILTPDGKAALRKQLLRAARAASEHPRVEAIYITDFIVQL